MAFLYLSNGLSLSVPGMTREQIKGAVQRQGFMEFEVTTSPPGRSAIATVNADCVAAIADEPLPPR